MAIRLSNLRLRLRIELGLAGTPPALGVATGVFAACILRMSLDTPLRFAPARLFTERVTEEGI